jgi:hypothetical protein
LVQRVPSVWQAGSLLLLPAPAFPLVRAPPRGPGLGTFTCSSPAPGA